MTQTVILIKNLKKYYSVHHKKEGLLGSISSLFHREYEQVKAVDGISFEIEEGELVGFIGPNGAGKTTTLKVLSGLLYPTGGKVKVLGYDPWEREANYQKQFSLVMGQKNQLWWDLPAIESFNLNKEIYEIPESIFRKNLEELVELLEVEGLLNLQVRKLSLGQRMKMELIAALLHSPKLLFLDEPTIGLDVVMQKRMRDFIKEINKRKRSTIVLTSHYMEDVKELAKRVIIIDHGRILFDGGLEDIINKFANYKTVSITFSKKINPKNLSQIGKIQNYQFPQATLTINRDLASEIAARLLKEYPVEDLNIEEPRIEDVIREVFTKKETVGDG